MGEELFFTISLKWCDFWLFTDRPAKNLHGYDVVITTRAGDTRFAILDIITMIITTSLVDISAKPIFRCIVVVIVIAVVVG